MVRPAAVNFSAAAGIRRRARPGNVDLERAHILDVELFDRGDDIVDGSLFSE